MEKADLSAYKDGGAVSAYARGYVAAMLQAGIVNGVSEDTLGVGGQITRGGHGDHAGPGHRHLCP